MKRGFLNGSKMKKNPLYVDPAKNLAADKLPTLSGDREKTSGAKVENAEDKPGAPPIAKQVGQSTTPGPSMFSLAEFLEHGIEPLLKRTSIVTVPPRKHAPGDGDALVDSDPDGHAKVLTYPDTPIPERLTHPGYPKPVPKTTHINYTIRATPDMGQGMFAARDIKAYELVFAERPILVTSNGAAPPINVGVAPGQPMPPGKASDMRNFQVAFRKGWEKQLEMAVGRMKEDDRKAWMDLVDTNLLGPWSGKIQTNGFAVVGLRGEGDTPDQIQEPHYSGIGKVSSRINHSCVPSIVQRFSVNSFCLTFTAVKDIKEGEQFFYSYTNPYQPVAARRKALYAVYRFTCKCATCENATPEQEELREKYMDSVTTLYRASFQPFTSLGAAERALEGARKFKERNIKAGIADTVVIDGIIFTYLEKINERKRNFAEAARCRAERGRLLKIESMMYD